jgi:hypothetical protein
LSSQPNSRSIVLNRSSKMVGSKSGFAASLWCFAATGVWIDVGNHPLIENGLAVRAAVIDAIQTDNASVTYAAFDRFVSIHAAKYPMATDTLKKDRESLLAFYDFPV